MDRLVILSEELKKYFILTDEKGKYKHSQWKCNVDECGKIMDIGIRMEHLRHNHINIFQQIDKKLPKDIIKKRLSALDVKCVEKSLKTNEIFPNIEGYNFKRFYILVF